MEVVIYFTKTMNTLACYQKEQGDKQAATYTQKASYNFYFCPPYNTLYRQLHKSSNDSTQKNTEPTFWQQRHFTAGHWKATTMNNKMAAQTTATGFTSLQHIVCDPQQRLSR